jgi:hypothetical protein
MAVLGGIFVVVGIGLMLASAVTTFGPDPQTDTGSPSFTVGIALIVIGLVLMKRSDPES